MVTLTLNGQRKTLNQSVNLANFLKDEGYADMKVAVAKNGDFVAKGEYETTMVGDGDTIEIVAPMQGG